MFRVRELIEYGKTLDPMRFEKRLFIGGGRVIGASILCISRSVCSLGEGG